MPAEATDQNANKLSFPQILATNRGLCPVMFCRTCSLASSSSPHGYFINSTILEKSSVQTTLPFNGLHRESARIAPKVDSLRAITTQPEANFAVAESYCGSLRIRANIPFSCANPESNGSRFRYRLLIFIANRPSVVSFDRYRSMA